MLHLQEFVRKSLTGAVPTLTRAATFMEGYSGSDIEDVIKRCARNAWNRAQSSEAAIAAIAASMVAPSGTAEPTRGANGAGSSGVSSGESRSSSCCRTVSIVEYDLLLAVSQVSATSFMTLEWCDKRVLSFCIQSRHVLHLT